MSADLFAAFGPQVSPHKASERKYEDDGGVAASPGVLIPGIETLEIQQQHNIHQKSSQPKHEDERPLWRRDGRGTDVLFDATDEAHHDDEDFGDFEDANAVGEKHTMPYLESYAKQESTRHPPSSNMPMLDLLGLDQDDTNTDPVVAVNFKFASINALSIPIAEPAASTTPTEDEWGDFSAPATYEVVTVAADGTKATQLQPSQTSETQQGPTEDDWDAFEDGETESLDRAQAQKPREGLSAAQVAVVPQLDPPPKSSLPTQRTGTETAEIVRPSNIPPPAIILQLLPDVFGELRQTVAKRVKQNAANRTDSPQRDIALKIIHAFTVAARIISGRALRWKRDAILAQSMRMGPAASTGGGRGMKLAAIDKSESLKEEKEAADVVSAWEKSAHLFNSAVSKAGIQRPLMALYLSVRPRLTSGLDVLKASHPCALCGINRDERVSQVDFNVEDSFGEYWMEHWGHQDCRDFWTTYKSKLQQR